MSSTKEEVFHLIQGELVERYRRKNAALRERGNGQLPGKWFGLQEISRVVVGNDFFAMTTNYRMDDNLCGALEVPSGTLLAVSEVSGQVTELHIPNFDLMPADFVRIKQNLDSSVSWFLLDS